MDLPYRPRGVGRDSGGPYGVWRGSSCTEGPPLSPAEYHSRVLRSARGASAHQPPGNHEQSGRLGHAGVHHSHVHQAAAPTPRLPTAAGPAAGDQCHHHRSPYQLLPGPDDIVLTILLCEVLLGWLNGFWIFWKDGWNILNFIIVFILLLRFFINEINIPSINYTLRALRLVHVCMAVEPLARIIRVILQSVPDMANIMVLILFFMLVFSVFGVTLFGAFVPKHFQNIQVALYTLFICITQDGWVDIYSDFQTEKREYAMEIGGAIYFTIFITIGAFIGINLFVIVVTTNLEQMMKAGEQGQQQRITFSETGAEEEEENDQLPLVHCVVARSEKSGLLQEPLAGGPLSNLSENTCDNFCLVLEAIQENLRQYKEIRDELNMIVEEVRAIRFNQEQESEVLNRRSSSSKDIRQMPQQQDLLSALVSMEKVHDSSSQILLKKHKSSH
ncbi:cation channel sperm-associated protein 4 isoform X3 [Pan paniscus]|uniref:cation channel sperm-associated protein 4 isoform X3 n=1 Tax=Pan paniscus TaxID=9597 RepID=UPI0024367E26|nr:cation channel sperm-associated protein 4 isoform X3 [Pan paniscus]